VQRSRDNLTPAARPGNKRRAFNPKACRHRYSHGARQFAIAEAAARREAQKARRKA
jgi:hypothetical protein